MKKILVYGMSNGFGGIQSFFLNLIHYSDKNKVIYDFVLSSETPVLYEKQIIKNDGKIHPITPWGANPKTHANELRQVLEETNYDYVWINATSASNLTVFKTVERYSNAEIIIHAHGSSFETRNIGIKKNALKILHYLNVSKLNRYADYKFAVSNEAARWLFGREATASNQIQIINNGIETEKYVYDSTVRKEYREKLGITNELTILQVGRIEKVKNHALTLKVFKELLKKQPNSMLLIIGTGSLEDELKLETKALGIEEKVFFLGYKEDIENYFNAVDCLLLPSFSEGLPLTVLEAQVSGLKSVVSKEAVPYEANITELVSYKSLQETPEAWAEEVYKISKSYTRENQYEKVKSSGFDIEDTVVTVEKVLNL